MLADVFFVMDGFNKPAIIFNHGFKGFKDWGIWDLVAEAFAKEGFVFIKFNQSHNGTTPDNPTEFSDLEAFGHNTYSRELYDLDQMLKWVEGNSNLPTDLIDRSRINLIGHSRGGATAILKAGSNGKVRKLATWSSFKDIGERYSGPEFGNWENDKKVEILNGRTGQQMPQYYEIWEDYKANESAFDIQSALSKLSIPVMIAHGTEDPTVLFKDALDLKSANKDAHLYLVPNADHVYGGSHPYKSEELPAYAQQLVRETASFLKS